MLDMLLPNVKFLLIAALGLTQAEGRKEPRSRAGLETGGGLTFASEVLVSGSMLEEEVLSSDLFSDMVDSFGDSSIA